MTCQSLVSDLSGVESPSVATARMQADPPIDPAVQKGLNYKGLRDVVHKVTSQDRTVGIEEGKKNCSSLSKQKGAHTT